MTHYILFFLGAIALWMGIKANDEVHRLAVTAAAIFPLSWGFFSSPFLFQFLSGIVIISAYQIHISSS